MVTCSTTSLRTSPERTRRRRGAWAGIQHRQPWKPSEPRSCAGKREWRRGGATRAFAVREAATGVLVGQCEIRLKDAEIGEMSYVVCPAHRGPGFATRAVRLACDFAFAELGVERMELYIEPDNLPSRAVAHNAGFVEEGVLRNQGEVGDAGRDMLICSRLPSD
jgi:RimJ/RimL family protein N-acetyltransferase